MSTSGQEPARTSLEWQVRLESLPGPRIFAGQRRCVICNAILQRYNDSVNLCAAHKPAKLKAGVVVSLQEHINEKQGPRPIQYHVARCKCCGRVRSVELVDETLERYLLRRPNCSTCTPLSEMRKKGQH